METIVKSVVRHVSFFCDKYSLFSGERFCSVAKVDQLQESGQVN